MWKAHLQLCRVLRRVLRAGIVRMLGRRASSAGNATCCDARCQVGAHAGLGQGACMRQIRRSGRLQLLLLLRGRFALPRALPVFAHLLPRWSKCLVSRPKSPLKIECHCVLSCLT